MQQINLPSCQGLKVQQSMASGNGKVVQIYPYWNVNSEHGNEAHRPNMVHRQMFIKT